MAPREYLVEGTTFAPSGSVKSSDGKGNAAELQSEPIQRLAEIASVCNDSQIVYNEVSPIHIRWHLPHLTPYFRRKAHTLT